MVLWAQPVFSVKACALSGGCVHRGGDDESGVPFRSRSMCTAAPLRMRRRVVGLPALRSEEWHLHGDRALACGFIVEEVFARMGEVNGGNAGLPHKGHQRVGVSRSRRCRYLAALVVSLLATLAVLKHACVVYGRASLPIATRGFARRAWASTAARYKTLSFADLGGRPAWAAPLYAHKCLISPISSD